MFKNLKFSKNYCVLFFLVSALCFFIVDFKGEADIWFLLSHGRYVLSNGLPHVDILSMHTGLNFVMQQWLSSVVFHLIYDYLGNVALYLFVFLINCVITYLIYRLCLIISEGKKFSSCFVSCITTIVLQIGFVVPRPQIFTFIFLILLFILLELYSSKRKKYIYFIPLLSILLINFHASMWPMLFIFSMPYVAELILKKDKDVFKLIIILVISALVGLINPYGYEAIMYSFIGYGNSYIRMVVGEMHSFNLLTNYFVGYWSFFILILFLGSNLLMLFFTKKNNFRIAHLLLFYGTFFMALNSIRNCSLFIIATLPFLVKYFKFKDIDKFTINWKWFINYLLVVVALVGVLIFAVNDKKYEFSHSCMNSVNYLNEHASKDIKLYTDYSDGSIYEYYGYKPYLDSRAEVFIKKMNKKENILKEYIEFNINEETREEFINKYDFDYYSVGSENYELINYLINYKDNKFELVYADTNIYLIKKVK